MRLLWLGLGILGGLALSRRNDKARQLVDKLSQQVEQQGRQLSRRMGGRSQKDQWKTPSGKMASSAYGAGSASLEQPDMPLASTAYSAGTASLPMDEQEIRDPNTSR